MPSRSQDAPLQAPDSRACLVRTWGAGALWFACELLESAPAKKMTSLSLYI